jgi:hypothetical protein
MVFARIASMMFTTLRLVLLEWNQNKKGVPREGTPFWFIGWAKSDGPETFSNTVSSCSASACLETMFSIRELQGSMVLFAWANSFEIGCIKQIN